MEINREILMADYLWRIIREKVTQNCQGCKAEEYSSFPTHDCSIINQPIQLLYSAHARRYFDIWYEHAMLAMDIKNIHMTRYIIKAKKETLFRHVLELLPETPYSFPPPHAYS
jgi:hypothetical protein